MVIDKEGKPVMESIDNISKELDDVSQYMNDLISRSMEGHITQKEFRSGVLKVIDKVLMQMKKDFDEEDERGIEGVVELIKHLNIGQLHNYLNRGDTNGK